MAARVLLIDKYDSFTYNLVQELGELGAEPVVFRNDAIDIAGIRAAAPDAVIISPGPGRPENSGISLAVVAELGGEIPLLGVCLGHQCIGQAFGEQLMPQAYPKEGTIKILHPVPDRGLLSYEPGVRFLLPHVHWAAHDDEEGEGLEVRN